LLDAVHQRVGQFCQPQVARAITSHGLVEEPPTVRKEITILFADLRDFTPLTERLEPEEVAGLLDEFFTAMTEVLLREDACIDKYIGDEIMAFFGDPIDHVDHPQRAFRAALAMQARMRELNITWESQGRATVGLGIGIATGHATVGFTGAATRREYTALGSIVNVASRLSDIAAPGQILTTRKTYWRVQDTVEGTSQGPVEIKGFAQPIEVIAAVGERLAHLSTESAGAGRWIEVIERIVQDPAYRGLLLWNPEEARHTYPLSREEEGLAQRVAVLSGCPLFRGVPAEEITAVMAAATVREVSDGTTVVQQGADDRNFYVLLKGDVMVTTHEGQDPEQHIASLSTGGHFGEVSLLFDTRRNATVRTLSAASFLVLHQEAFYSVLDRAPAFRGNLEQTARERLNERSREQAPLLSSLTAASVA